MKTAKTDKNKGLVKKVLTAEGWRRLNNGVKSKAEKTSKTKK
jgi:hypothetical protein